MKNAKRPGLPVILKALIGEEQVTCRGLEFRKYGRRVGTVFVIHTSTECYANDLPNGKSCEYTEAAHVSRAIHSNGWRVGHSYHRYSRHARECHRSTESIVAPNSSLFLRCSAHGTLWPTPVTDRPFRAGLFVNDQAFRRDGYFSPRLLPKNAMPTLASLRARSRQIHFF